MIDDFKSKEALNLLGGLSGVFHKDADSKEEYCKLSFETIPESKGVVLKLEYKVLKEGFGGYFTKLKNFDARMFQNISFMIKSVKPISKLKLELKSDNEVGVYLLTNISQKYKKVTIPLNKFSGINNFNKLK